MRVYACVFHGFIHRDIKLCSIVKKIVAKINRL